jgi:hypothetical protein
MVKVTNLRVTQGYSELSLLHSDSRKDINRETKEQGSSIKYRKMAEAAAVVAAAGHQAIVPR